jgi:hypothetical protein
MSNAEKQDKVHSDMAAVATYDGDSQSHSLQGRVTELGRPPESRQSFVEGLKYGAAGGVAGAFAKSCTAPLARLTILYQVSLHPSWALLHGECHVRQLSS